MFSCFRTSPIKHTITTYALESGGRKAILSWETIKYLLRYIDESKSKTLIMSHQFCPPRLVLPVGGRVRGWRGGGGWVEWGGLGVQVTGLTLIINNFETNK